MRVSVLFLLELSRNRLQLHRCALFDHAEGLVDVLTYYPSAPWRETAIGAPDSLGSLDKMPRRPHAASAGYVLALAAVLGMTDGLVISPNRNPTKSVAPLVRPLILQSARLTRQRYDALQIEGTNRRPPTEYELNRGKAIDALNADATRFADAELDWSIYSEQIQLADPTGVRARGLANYKRFFQLVRLFRSLMVDDVSVRHRLRVDDANGRIVICWYSTWRTSMAKKPIQIDAVDSTSPARTAAAPRHRRDVEFHTASDRNKRTSWKKRL